MFGITRSRFFSILALAVIASICDAAIVPVNETNFGAAGSGDFTWRYRFDLPDRARVENGDFITIYDFRGFTGEHSEPAGWTFQSRLSGPVPSLIAVEDDPTIPNLTWSFGEGLTISGPPLTIGIFEAHSIYDLFTDSAFAAQATADEGPLAGTLISNVGTITTPIPEPMVLLPAMFALMALRRR